MPNTHLYESEYESKTKQAKVYPSQAIKREGLRRAQGKGWTTIPHNTPACFDHRKSNKINRETQKARNPRKISKRKRGKKRK